MPEDIRLEFRVRNNVLWHAIFDLHDSVSAFCRQHQLREYDVGSLLNLMKSPYMTAKGTELRLTARRICEITGIGRDELWPPLLYADIMPKRGVIELPSDRFLPLAAARRLALPPAPDGELGEVLRSALKSLKPREADIIRRRFGFDGDEESLREIGKSLNVGPERVRQIEKRALRKLRNPRCSRMMRPWALANPTGKGVRP